MKVTFLRHGEPLRTPEHHSLWDITDSDKQTAKSLFTAEEKDDFDTFVSSTLQRAISTGEFAVPQQVWQRSKLFDEIEKPIENEHLFKFRVEKGLQLLKEEYSFKRRILVAGHSRWMSFAYFILHKQPALGFDFLEHFTVEV
jgi:hypothetical protein